MIVNRLKNKEVKVRRLNDPVLVKIDWDVFYSGEKESQSEEDCLPPQPEDASIFFNSCSKTRVNFVSCNCKDSILSALFFILFWFVFHFSYSLFEVY